MPNTILGMIWGRRRRAYSPVFTTGKLVRSIWIVRVPFCLTGFRQDVRSVWIMGMTVLVACRQRM